MHQFYRDILSRIPESPKWFDDNGVPRYEDFSPDLIADIYAVAAILLEIECQGCGTNFMAAISWRSSGPFELEYGDPPNIECCRTGPTMNSVPLRVCEYWVRDSSSRTWERRPERETAIDCEWIKD